MLASAIGYMRLYMYMYVYAAIHDDDDIRCFSGYLAELDERVRKPDLKHYSDGQGKNNYVLGPVCARSVMC